MASVLVLAATDCQVLTATSWPDSPFQGLVGLSRAQMADTRELPAAERRLLTEHFVSAFHWHTVRPQLPFRLAIPAEVPVWQPRRCRSHYVWLPPDDIHTVDDLAGLDDFDLVLRLFDFTAWRPILGQRFRSQFGPPPFDPVSLALAGLLARWRNWTWPQLVTELASPERGGGYCRRLGFDPGDLPAISTLRTAWGDPDSDVPWCLQCQDSLADGLMALGLIPEHSTLPDDPPERGVSIATDSQLVEARSHTPAPAPSGAAAGQVCAVATRMPLVLRLDLYARVLRGRQARRAAHVIPRLVKTRVATPQPATRRPPTSTMPVRTSRVRIQTTTALTKRRRAASTTLATRPKPLQSSTIASSLTGP